jgi:Fe-S-cluster containining protein
MAELVVPDERFSCQSCGRCCTMWTITVDEARVEQLRKHDWGGPDPFLRRRGEGDAYRLRMIDGPRGRRCVFLDESNRCRVHARLGYNAKPEGCKAFPLHAATVAGKTHLRLSFYCPSVCGGEGKRLSEQMGWVKATVKAAGDVARRAPLQLDDELELTSGDLEAIEAALLALLQRREASAADRLAAGSALLDRLARETHARGKSALRPTLQQAESAELTALAAEGRQGGAASRAGPVLSLFLGADCGPSSWARLGHFFGVRLFQIGLGRLRSRLVSARASRGAIRRVRLEGEDALLTRYLVHKLRARRCVSGELTLRAGYNLLVVAYAVANILARLRAATDHRASCSVDDLAAAVQAADLLVVEHTTLYQGSLVGALTDTVLTQDKLCASLLARLGESS